MKTFEQLLAETKAIVEAATSGPWESINGGICDSNVDVGGNVCGICPETPEAKANEAFILHSRTMMPALIEALELAVEQRDIAIEKWAWRDPDNASLDKQSIVDRDIAFANDKIARPLLRKAGDK